MVAVNMFNNAAASKAYGYTNSLSQVTLNPADTSDAARGMIFTQSGWGDGFNITSANINPIADGNGCLNRHCQGKNSYDEFGNTPTSTIYFTA